MTTFKHSTPIRLFRVRQLFLPAIAALGLVAVSSLSGNATAHATDDNDSLKLTVLSGKDSYSVKVALNDLDLSTTDGYRIANQRIQSAARKVCLRAVDAHDRSSRVNYLSCFDASSAGVVPQLQHLADVSRKLHTVAKN